MKKTIVVIFVLFFVLQGMIHIPADNAEQQSYKELIIFPKAQQRISGEKIFVEMDEMQQYASLPGEYLRPMMVKTFTFPFGTVINEVDVVFSQAEHISLFGSLAVKTSPQTTSEGTSVTYQEKHQDDDPIEASFDVMIDNGIINQEHVVYLKIYISPMTYNPKTQQATIYKQATINIQKSEDPQPQTFPDEYDMVIITPELFSEQAQPLVEHKNTIGITTFLKTCEEIYQEYNGRDNAEKIKYFIKDAIETKGISYVLLIGGRNGGIFEEKWYLPVRYANVDDDAETSYISDLYYADIYNETGDFATWDTNGNGILAEWKNFKKDELGLIPDVYLGRLPCRTNREVSNMVNKIIAYETSDKSSWFSNMVVVGGDSAPGDEYNEGEEENKQALLYMDDFTSTRCWTSDETFTGTDDVMNAINPGCGFLFFDGHANPASWSTHPPGDKKTWINGLTVFDMPKLENGNKHPICVVGGCHIAQFNVSLTNLIRDIIHYGPMGYFFNAPLKFYHMEWVPRCWSWQLASMKEGGSIATLGYTGLDWFAVGDDNNDGIPDCTQFYSGFMNTHFFKNYGQNNITILGQTHTQTLIDYITVHPPMNFVLDCKTVEEFTLLGDPSLHMVAKI